MFDLRESKGVRVARDLGAVLRGYLEFRRKGATPMPAYVSMRRLYCDTNGYFNDVAAVVASVLHPPRALRQVGGVLGHMKGPPLERVLERLRTTGFHVFQARLPAQAVEELVSLASSLPCAPPVRYGSAQSSRQWKPYAARRGTAPRYDFDMQTLCRTPEIQRLMADASIQAVAAAYLRCEPILDLVAMWWSEPSPPDVDLKSEAAQLFHFDMDRLKFLKFFFYLTDVDTDTGPHCLIQGSHRRKPRAALRDGRHTDESLHQLYPDCDFKEVSGPRGTVLAVDTRAFHKGKPLVSGARLLLQLEYSVSRFGSNYPRVQLESELPELSAARREHPRVYEMFTGPSPE